MPETKTNATMIGVVESDARAKTRKVVIASFTPHAKYGKYIRQRTILQVHDEKNASHNGDIVEVTPCKPKSKSKTWTLVRIVEQRSEKTAALVSVRKQAESTAV